MPATVPSARYDMAWKAAISHALRAFMVFFFPALGAQIDWKQRPRFRDKELAAIGFGNTAGSLVATAKLLDFAGRDDALIASHNPFAWLTLAHLRAQQARHDPAALYAAKWQCTTLLYQHRWSKKTIIVLFRAINWMMPLPEPYQQRYLRAVIKLEKEHNMELLNQVEQTFMDKGWEKGLRKGLQQGLEQGRREGALALLEQQLVRRFGPLPKTAHDKLAKADLAQLQAWNAALPEAASLRLLLQTKS